MLSLGEIGEISPYAELMFILDSWAIFHIVGANPKMKSKSAKTA